MKTGEFLIKADVTLGDGDTRTAVWQYDDESLLLNLRANNIDAVADTLAKLMIPMLQESLEERARVFLAIRQKKEDQRVHKLSPRTNPVVERKIKEKVGTAATERARNARLPDRKAAKK